MPKTSTVSTSSLMILLALGLPAFAVGCGAGGTELEDTARNISRRSSQTLEHAGMAGAGADDDENREDGEETDYNAATDEGSAGAGPDDADGEDMGSDAEPGSEGEDDAAAASGPAAGSGGSESEPMAPEGPGPSSDDSVRCGNGVIDLGELCDIRIPYGEEGACPKAEDCVPLDACHAPKLLVHGCKTACVLGEPVEC